MNQERRSEFTTPGVLVLIIGTISAALGIVIGQPVFYHGIVTLLLIVTGVCLLLRLRIGTLLFVILLAIATIDGINSREDTSPGMFRIILGYVILLWLLICVYDQIRYFRSQRKNDASDQAQIEQ